jgi:hypothetical protein
MPKADEPLDESKLEAVRWIGRQLGSGHRGMVTGPQATAAAAALPAVRPENRQPPRKVPSSER